MTELDSKEEIRQWWRIYLLEYELAKYYHYPYLLYSGSTQRNPLLDQLLPSLLVIRVVSILNGVLEFELDSRGITLPQGKYKDNLKGRIEILGDTGVISDAYVLHRLRVRRNELAHDLSKPATWEELSETVNVVEATLQELGYVGSRPKLEYFGERSALSDSPDPNIRWTREFKVGIKENDKIALEWSWTQNFLKDNT